MTRDETFMKIALEEAEAALDNDEIPVGAVIVRGDEILSRAHNSPITLSDPSAHAEIMAIRKASEKVGNYRLNDTTLYVTLEPCIMCAGAILHARISRLVFGAFDPKGGAVTSLYSVFDDARLNHVVDVTGGVFEKECSVILSGFFRKKRVSSHLAPSGKSV